MEKEDIQHVLAMLAKDDELWAGGIPPMDRELVEQYGLTERQSANIQIRLWKLMKYMRNIKGRRTI